MTGDAAGSWHLERFVEAQNERGTYARALAEVRHGLKVSHWMWFVFPQLAALGRSSRAKHYGISGLADAQAYLAHSVLGPRLRECTRAVLALDDEPKRVFGPVDEVKLRSCLTLFALAAPDESVFTAVITKHYDGASDSATIGLLYGS